MEQRDLEKRNAAKASVGYVKDGMIVGLGSGSTSEYMVEALGDLVAVGLKIQAVPSSERIHQLASARDIPLRRLAEVKQMDLYIDGADEIDPDFQMIKGGGGALLREKILAHNAKQRIIIVDSSKKVPTLGAFPLPIEVIPFSLESVTAELEKIGLSPLLRIKNKEVFNTDEGNVILDCSIQSTPKTLYELNTQLLAIPGIVETGLFLDYVDLLIMGKENDVVISAVKKS